MPTPSAGRMADGLASAALERLRGTRHKLLVLAFEPAVSPKPPSIPEEEDT